MVKFHPTLSSSYSESVKDSLRIGKYSKMLGKYLIHGKI